MKPSSRENDSRRRGPFFRSGQKRLFPITDCDYQAFSHDRYYGGAERNQAGSFLNISREYFRCEAPRNFLVEAAFFLALAAILMLPLIGGAMDITHFLN